MSTIYKESDTRLIVTPDDKVQYRLDKNENGHFEIYVKKELLADEFVGLFIPAHLLWKPARDAEHRLERTRGSETLSDE